MKPPPLTEKPLRPMPFQDLKGVSQRQAVYIWGMSAMIIGVLFLLCIGVPLVVFVLWPHFVRWGWPGTLTTLTLLISFMVGHFIGSWTGTLLVLDLGNHDLLRRRRK